MKTKNVLTALLITGAVLGASTAQAVSLSWSQRTTAYVNQVFDPSPAIGLSGPAQYSNISVGDLLITTGAAGAVFTVTYLGQESGFSDGVARASFANTLLTESNNVGDTASFFVAGGLTSSAVDFKFFDSSLGSAVNGGAWSIGNSIGLIGTNVNVGGYGSFAYVLGYNDSGTGHDDWDDFVIGVNAVDRRVPEPGTLALLGLGLIGLGFGRRRKTA